MNKLTVEDSIGVLNARLKESQEEILDHIQRIAVLEELVAKLGSSFDGLKAVHKQILVSLEAEGIKLKW